MRRAGVEGSIDGEEQDNLLFRPIGQTSILAPYAGYFLIILTYTPQATSKIHRCLKPLSHMLNWSLQWCLWRDLLTFKDLMEGGKCGMKIG